MQESSLKCLSGERTVDCSTRGEESGEGEWSGVERRGSRGGRERRETHEGPETVLIPPYKHFERRGEERRGEQRRKKKKKKKKKRKNNKKKKN